ncbi:MAG TPA: hypothetical protein VF893_03680 [Candidatus Bathyarchaeia archaeon]
MSHLICSMALVALILVLPSFFAMERNGVAEQMAQRELTEICDYTSNTLENLFLLANSTNVKELNVTKELIYLPMTVEGSFYTLRIDAATDDATSPRVTAFLNDRSWVQGSSWLVPGLKVNEEPLAINGTSMVAGCTRNAAGFYVWIKEGE